jgi:hypothetical protein
MPNFVKKITVSLMLSLVLVFSFGKNVLAQSPPPPSSAPAPWYNQGFPGWYDKVYNENTSPGNEIFGERYTAAQVQWVFYGVFSTLINAVADPKIISCFMGGDMTACGQQVEDFFNSVTNAIADSGGTDLTKSLAAKVFDTNRPLSGIGYIKDRIQNFSLIPVAHAQATTSGGFGFGAFGPVQGLWRASRNFAYALSVLAIIILAFMVMFRVKISPQVVISAQSAIPKVIIALIFVTFSYAIAGLLVDFMYVVIGVLAYFFAQASGASAVTGAATANFSMMTTGIPNIGGGFLTMMILYFLIFSITLFVTIFLTGSLVANTILTISGSLPLIMILILIIALVVLLFMTVKIFWLLLKTMAMTYLLVVVGPLQIIMGAALPSAQGVGVGSWIKSMLTNLAVYPVVGSLFLLSFIFAQFGVKLAFTQLVAGGIIDAFIRAILGTNFPLPSSGWVPPLVLGADKLPIVFVAISFVLITIIPKTVEMIQAFMAGKPFGFGEAIGEAVGPVGGLAKVGASLYVNKNRAADEKTAKKGARPPVRPLDTVLENTLLRRGG